MIWRNLSKHADTAHDDHCKDEEDCKYDENDERHLAQLDQQVQIIVVT